MNSQEFIKTINDLRLANKGKWYYWSNEGFGFIATATRKRILTPGFLCEQDTDASVCGKLATAEYKYTERDPYDGITITYTYRCNEHTADLTRYTKINLQPNVDELCSACGASISPDDLDYYPHLKGRC